MRRPDFWPTREQELLLTAALGNGDAALSAWVQWRARAALESADHGTLRLLPLVYANLARGQALSDSSFAILKERYLRSRIASRELLRRLARLLALFEINAIPTLVLKGAALGPLVYRDPSLRPMGDFDIAVPHAHASRAMALLLQNGWSPEKLPSRVQARPASLAALTFTPPEGVTCDLHFSLFPECLSWDAVAPFWAAAVPCTIEGANALTLSATDHLLHTLSHGARANAVSPIRWVADAIWLMRGEAPILWDRLVAQAHALRLSLVAGRTLAYLRDTHGAAVPPHVVAALLARRSMLESLEYAVRRGAYRRLAPLIGTWGRYVRLHQNRAFPALVGGFPFYLQEQWSARDLRETVRIGLRKLPFLPR